MLRPEVTLVGIFGKPLPMAKTTMFVEVVIPACFSIWLFCSGNYCICLKSEFGLMSKLFFVNLVFQWWSPLHPSPSPMQYQWCHKNPAIQKVIKLESHNGMMHERKFITVKFWKVGFYLSSLWQTNWPNCNRRFSIGRFNFLLKFQNCNIMAFVVIGLKTTFWWSQPIWWYLMMN